MEYRYMLRRLRRIALDLRVQADSEATASRFNLAGDIMGVISQINRLANRMESNWIEPEPPQESK